MFTFREDFISYILLLIVSFFLVFDLFGNKGLSATFDGRMHATMIAQFTDAFRDGEIRVIWSNGFGNYGMPMALINHQIIGYGGGVINIFLDNVVLSLNTLLFLGAFLSAVFFYKFLRIYFSSESSFLGAFLFNFSAYRIFNVYIRGAYPEFLAGIFLPLLLIGIHSFIVNKNRYALLLIAISFAGIILSHPFTLLIYSFIFLPYFIYQISTVKRKIKPFLFSVGAMGMGILLSGFYFLPLLGEMKYFYYGQSENHLVPNQFLSFQNFFIEKWFYFYEDSPFVRGNYITLGLVETLLIFLCFGLLIYHLFVKKLKNIGIIIFVSISSVLLVLLTLSFSERLYTIVSLLANIQYPWRMLSGLIFLPPIILAFTTDLLSRNLKLMVILAVITLVAFLRFPQLYGKNYTVYPEEYFYNTRDNVAAVVLNPIWSGLPEEYPERKQQVEIIDGKGTIVSQYVTNSTREYMVDATEPLRMIDYTFYFPGWNLFIDGVQKAIEYQDVNYRGVITYQVPEGKHVVSLRFEDTKVRLFGLFSSGFACVVLLGSVFLMKYKKRLFI